MKSVPLPTIPRVHFMPVSQYYVQFVLEIRYIEIYAGWSIVDEMIPAVVCPVYDRAWEIFLHTRQWAVSRPLKWRGGCMSQWKCVDFGEQRMLDKQEEATVCAFCRFGSMCCFAFHEVRRLCAEWNMTHMCTVRFWEFSQIRLRRHRHAQHIRFGDCRIDRLKWSPTSRLKRRIL